MKSRDLRTIFEGGVLGGLVDNVCFGGRSGPCWIDVWDPSLPSGDQTCRLYELVVVVDLGHGHFLDS